MSIMKKRLCVALTDHLVFIFPLTGLIILRINLFFTFILLNIILL